MSTAEQMWVGRAAQFVDTHKKGIDTWRGTVKVPVTTLSQKADAHLKISDVVKDGVVVGRLAKFYMQGKHMATLHYGPSLRFRTRKVEKIDYHV